MSDEQSRGPAVVTDLAKELTVIGPTRGDAIDWNASEAVYGRLFPADYRAFVALFGHGSIEEMVGIRTPAVTSEELHQNKVSPLAPHALADTTVNNWAAPVQAGEYRLEDLLIWGETTAADTFAWIAADSDPDRWPVAVYSRFELAWSVYPGGMAEFLLRLLRDGFEEWPISDTSLRGVTRPRFLHDQDEEAAWESGTNPWE
ncbi:hypothetical protein ACFV8T_36110 [Streptomyces sp. NPDC059832]|uniref:hypothetical protein n=1 Tax=Streptomyces sp. NPDC059832 TaxID=3346966 RepID=UPI003664258F